MDSLNEIHVTRKKEKEQTSSLIGSKQVKFRKQELVKPCHEQHTQFQIIWNGFPKTNHVIKTSQLCFLKIVGMEWRLCSCTMQKAEFPGHCEVVTVKVETLSAPFVLPFPVLLHKYTVHLADDSYESIKKVTNASQFLTSSTWTFCPSKKHKSLSEISAWKSEKIKNNLD